MEMQRKKIVIFGYGQRGKIYADYTLKCPEEFNVVAVIETNAERREMAKTRHSCPVFCEYKDFLDAKIQADIVAVATQDCDHPEHAVACMEKGFDILLEKPIATTEEGCQQIVAATEKYGRKVIVCHVLRYTPFYQKVKEKLNFCELAKERLSMQKIDINWAFSEKVATFLNELK